MKSPVFCVKSQNASEIPSKKVCATAKIKTGVDRITIFCYNFIGEEKKVFSPGILGKNGKQALSDVLLAAYYTRKSI